MKYLGRKYAIIPTANVTDIVVSHVLELNQEAMRTTVAGESKTLLRWDGNTPDLFADLPTYSHSEIIQILNNDKGNWWAEINI